MVRETFATVALHVEAIGALRRARRLVATRPDAIEAMTQVWPASNGARSNPYIHRVGRALVRTARVVPRSTCLVIAVAGHELLARRGIHATLCIGHDAASGGAFSAHAWLELNGQAVVGQPSPNRFTR